MATKIIGSPETKWIDATSGIYSSDKASNLSVTTDFSESLQSSVSILRSVSIGYSKATIGSVLEVGEEFTFFKQF